MIILPSTLRLIYFSYDWAHDGHVCHEFLQIKKHYVPGNPQSVLYAHVWPLYLLIDDVSTLGNCNCSNVVFANVLTII